MSETINVLGVGFDNFTMSEAVDAAYVELREHRAAYVVTPNPEIVMHCYKDEAAAEAVRGAFLTIPDGIGVVIGSKILKTPLKQKVSGCDFALALMERMNAEGRSVFLFGAAPGVAEKAEENLRRKFPELRFVGTNDGYFKDDAPIVEKINAAAPDLLLVCLGAPKQEKWMYENAPKLNVGLMIGAGGSMDVYAGTVKRAPELWCRLNLEWLYRLLKQPQRIGRMMVLPEFLIKVCLKRGK